MSGLNLKYLNASENEFIAEETLITIQSNFDHPTFTFISGNFGPFVTGIPIQVPLWFAITMRKKGKCTILPPEWMSTVYLENAVKNERSSKTLSELPYHYMEIALLLLNNAREDIPSPDQIAVLLKDLENIRMDRIKSGIRSIAESVNNADAVVSANLNNASALEIYTIKRFLLESMNSFVWFVPPNTEGDESGTQDDLNQSTEGGRRLRRFRNS